MTGRAKPVKDCPVAKGDRVQVRETNIRPWGGVVRAVKWSPVTGWWIEIRRDEYDTTYVMPAGVVERIEGEAS